ncbi:nucleoside deaminase [Cohnella sp. GCM10020058]|uniref:nucleoside deaminase n=1 Tax=Cohnella sp. GCM10020058 TaxID=3317330 RepID=UPI00363C69CD
MNGKEKELHLFYIRKCVEVSRQARSAGNTPFGCVLVGPEGEVLMEQGNIEITGRVCTGHAETSLMQRASHAYPKPFLWRCTLYSTAEPCAMCAGAIYWGNVGRVVYGISEQRLAELTGDDEQNPTLDMPCRDILASGRKPIEVVGPFSEIEQEVVAVHEGYWK